MKTLKILSFGILLFTLVFAVPNVNGQSKKEVKTSEFKIKVMFECAKGKAIIEKELVKEAGVTKVVADAETKIVTVNFDGSKTDRIKINTAIEKIGYQTELSAKDKKVLSPCSKTCGSKK